MARVSFTLRNISSSQDNTGGSYVRYDSGVYNTAASAANAASPGLWLYDNPEGTRDYDSALRADGVVAAPDQIATGFFEADAFSYGSISVKFGIPVELNSSGVPVIPPSIPAPFEAVLVYSSNRSPISVEDGIILNASSTPVDLVISGFPEGRWAYLTLFVRYRSTADDYYVPYASLEVLVPTNYGSTLRLWERLPETYRTQDETIGKPISSTGFIEVADGLDVSPLDIGVAPTSLMYGPLFRFLSIFGFEIDRSRTLMDYLMVAKDPLEANTVTLGLLSEMIGLNLTAKDINAGRLRNILSSYVYLLREKGTLKGMKDFIRVLSNCLSDVDDNAHTLTVYSQRVNYCYDPSNGNAASALPPLIRAAHEVEAVIPSLAQGAYDVTSLVDPSTGGFPYIPGMYWGSASAGTLNGTSVIVGDTISMYGDTASPQFAVRPKTFSSTLYSASSPTITKSGNVYTSDFGGSDSLNKYMWIRLPSPVPVLLGDRVYVSVDSDTSNHVLSGRLARIDDEAIVGEGGIVYFEGSAVAEVAAVSGVGSNWTLCFAEILVDLSSPFDLSNVLIERNNMGKWFDGSTRTGTWVVGSDGLTTDRDYRWSTRGSHNSPSSNTGPAISVYTEEYFKTVTLIQNMMPKIIPVQEYDKYDFDPTFTVYDGIPGLDEIDAYYDTLL